MTVIDKLRNYWQAEQFDQLAGSYSSDALLDIYVPAGRMQYRGTQSIIAFWRLDFGRPRQFRFLHWREHPTTWGSVIETSVLDEPTGRILPLGQPCLRRRRPDHPSRCVLHRRLDLHGSPALGARSGH
jgi:hypothetical protein